MQLKKLLAIFMMNMIISNNNKKENYTVLKDIGIAVIVEVIVLNLLNKLSLKNSIIILAIGFLCIGI